MIIDQKSNVPIFRQIADQLRNAIDAGVYRPGEVMPSLRALAIDIKVNANTVQRAYDALEREGVVETRRGVGIFVAQLANGKRNAVERKLISEFGATIRRSIEQGMTPDAVRQVFEESMRELVSKASR